MLNRNKSLIWDSFLQFDHIHTDKMGQYLIIALFNINDNNQ